MPQYFFFQAQRAEVTDAQEAEPKWTDLDWLVRLPDTADGGKPGSDKWATPYGEIVDSAYVFQPQTTPNNTSMKFYPTWPLPPLFLKYWGLEAGHPKVPFFKPESPSEQQEQPTDTEAPSNPFGFPGLGAAGHGPAASPGQRKAAPPAAAGPARRGGGPAKSAAAVQTDSGQASPGTSAYRLFRFVDMTAEKGKTYRYRVRLILANPNYGLKPEDLEKPESAKSEWRLSPWSDPSAVVTVPSEAQILADSLSAARAGADPLGKIYILTILKDEKSGDWVEVAKDFDVPLGGYASFKDVKIENVTDMAAEDVKTITAPAISADQAMLLDVRNDEPLGVSKIEGADRDGVYRQQRANEDVQFGGRRDGAEGLSAADDGYAGSPCSSGGGERPVKRRSASIVVALAGYFWRRGAKWP